MNMVGVILSILIFYPGQAGFDKETYNLTIPSCPLVEGVRKEDETCGLQLCLHKGRIRAAVLAGAMPGVGFGLICKLDDGTEAQEGAPATPGHGGMNFH